MKLTEKLDCTSAEFAEVSSSLLKVGIGLRFQARGQSMRPLVRDGDILLVNPSTPSSIKVSDVVLFINHYNRAILHRVIKRRVVRGLYFFTIKGDQVAEADGSIPQGDVLGKLTSIDRMGQTLLMDKPIMRLLSMAAMLRSRFILDQNKVLADLIKIIKRTNVFDRYLN